MKNQPVDAIVGDDVRLRANPLDTSRLELFLAGTKAALAGIPFVGGSIAEAVGYFGQREIDKRQKAFLEAIVRGLEAAQVDVSTLKESFWTTALHAAEVARRTHQREKIEALKNAVLNAAKPTAPDDDLQHIFLNMVADITPLHIRLLAFLTHPERFNVGLEDVSSLHALNPSNPRAAWDAIETHVAGIERRDLVELCFNDMVNRGLLAYSSDPPAFQGAILPYPTTVAEEFLDFITSHDEQQDVGTEPTSPR